MRNGGTATANRRLGARWPRFLHGDVHHRRVGHAVSAVLGRAALHRLHLPRSRHAVCHSRGRTRSHGRSCFNQNWPQWIIVTASQEHVDLI